MNGLTAVRTAKDQRRSARASYSGKATYRYARDDGGSATVVNLCPSGACLALGRYLRPGRFMLLALEADSSPRTTIELKTQVVWCRPTKNIGVFLTGVRILHDELDTEVTISELLSRTPENEPVPARRPVSVWDLDGGNTLKAAGTGGNGIASCNHVGVAVMLPRRVRCAQ